MYDYENRLSNKLGGNSSDRSLFWLMPILGFLRFVIIASILICILANGSPALNNLFKASAYSFTELVRSIAAEFHRVHNQ